MQFLCCRYSSKKYNKNSEQPILNNKEEKFEELKSRYLDAYKRCYGNWGCDAADLSCDSCDIGRELSNLRKEFEKNLLGSRIPELKREAKRLFGRD